jgi:hypothetical protein
VHAVATWRAAVAVVGVVAARRGGWLERRARCRGNRGAHGDGPCPPWCLPRPLQPFLRTAIPRIPPPSLFAHALLVAAPRGGRLGAGPCGGSCVAGTSLVAGWGGLRLRTRHRLDVARAGRWLMAVHVVGGSRWGLVGVLPKGQDGRRDGGAVGRWESGFKLNPLSHLPSKQ